MKKTITTKKRSQRVVGIDLSDRSFAYQELNGQGEVISSGTGKLNRESLREFLAQRPKKTRVAFEAGTHSGWVRDEVEAVGCEAIVANPRQIAVITSKRNRNDAVDAAGLAHYALVSPETLAPVELRPREQQGAMRWIRARSVFVDTGTIGIYTVRGLVKQSGQRIRKCDAASFAEVALEGLEEAERAIVTGLVSVIRETSRQIAEYDRKLEELASREYPETRYLRQVNGVGTLTALTFVLTLSRPDRVARSRDVGPLLGLVPARRQSGERDPHMRITKTGSKYLRKLLVQCSHRILGRRGEDSALRTWGLAHAGTSRATKRRAVVGVARKLAVLLHRLWSRQEVYRPYPGVEAAWKERSCA